MTAPPDGASPVVLLHQDRPEHIAGLRLAVASIRATCPDLDVWVSAPGATPELAGWLTRCGVRVVADPRFAGMGWNVKPRLLLWALEQGPSRVMWVDADVVVVRRPVRAIEQPESALVATEEFALGQDQGSRLRTEGWGLASGRHLPTTVNSGVLVVSGHHVTLLEHWAALLESDAYAAAQECPPLERPLHMLSDQDVLTALLGSATYARTDLRLLRRGRDIAQCAGPAGFSVTERLASLRRGGPALYHSVGVKPWEHGAAWRYGTTRLSRARARYEDMHLRLSAYTAAAGRFAPAAEVSLEAPAPRSPVGRVLTWLGRRWPALPELPLTLFDGAVRRLRRVLQVSRYSRG